MSIIAEVIYLIRESLNLFRGDWEKLKYDEVPSWVLKTAKRNYYKRRRNPTGKKYHFIGRHFFYRVWYNGRKNWIFYRKRK